MGELDKAEYERLESQVSEVERILGEGQATGGISGLLGEFLRNAKARMNEIRPEGSLSERERKVASQTEQLALAALVARESQLNAAEKEQYGSFLKQGWFTKSDFGDLDRFYSGTWDKLSEEGKAQMSYRVWEGVRQGEYSFAELPENVRKKESERLYEQLVDVPEISGALADIPEQDRKDFIREYEAGNDKAVAEVLNREIFAMKVSTTLSAEESLRDSSESLKKEADEPNREIMLEEQLKATADVSLAGLSMGEAPDSPAPPLPGSGQSGSIGKG